MEATFPRIIYEFVEKVKTKIVLTLNNNKFAGIERYCVLLCKYIDKTKFEITVVVPSYGELCDILKENNIKYVVLDPKNEGVENTFKRIISLINFIFKTKPDIVHAQAGILPCMLAKILGVKKIIEHKHGLDFTEKKLMNLSLTRLIFEKLKKYFVDYTITVCEKDRQHLIKLFNYSPDKVICIYNGIELDKFVNKHKGKNIILGNIGRLTYQKAQEKFIELAKILSMKNSSLRFLIYGKGEKEEFYLSLIQKYKIEKKISLKGFLFDVKKAFSYMDIFVLTSRYEGIPYILLEAMNYGIPVISTNVGGINEVIVNGKTGFLVENYSIDELVRCAEILISDVELRVKFAERAKETLSEKFSIQNCINNIANLYYYK